MSDGAIATIGPQHHGMRMTLDDFARVEGEGGHLYELDKGIIVVVDIPGLPHGLLMQSIRNALIGYQMSRPDLVFYVAAGSDAALRMPQMQSERHPDLTVYLTSPPTDDPQPWEVWTPDIVVEIVSPSSEERDYQIKRDEYLKAGVRLYWVVDPLSRTVIVHTRHGDLWREQRVDHSGTLKTSLLPGFELKLSNVFSAKR